MKETKSWLVATVVMLTLVGCSSTRSAGEQYHDKKLVTKVESKLAADTEINSFRIDVDARSGVVWLTGTVEKESTRQEAERLARETKGVRDVVNEIVVGDPSLARRAKDAAITTKVKTKLTGDPQVNPFNIDVDTENGVVTLSGVVRNEEARQEAEKLARDTKGVREVRNLIEVKERD